ncbi:hypothetical protein ACWT_3171 [Actinoplanes sp. SE50]|nr:hypothetical protein ACPL_3299 [Actinoplanes sp. SE50/110]ATO82586.1 hypothetical protein ACWT_3171 [Actinoplanes sp. SE50]SLL99993.1 hypothetical protein ACSP50_3225 [Actinoplanes sp. SE50/110]
MSGWRSGFMPAPEQLCRQRSRLLALRGQRLRAGAVTWDPAMDRWQPAGPVVLRFDRGDRLEIAWQGWDDLSITWNTVDLTTPPVITGRPHEWRSSVPPALAAVEGRILTGWAVTEDPYFPGGTDLTGELPMDAVAGWVMQGLLIRFGGSDLHVHAGADTTLVSAGCTESTTRVAHHGLVPDAA